MINARHKAPVSRAMAKLSADEQAKFDRLLRDIGTYPLATALGCSWTIVEKLQHGGHASPIKVDAVRARLRDLP